jgi:hypothetical protein
MASMTLEEMLKRVEAAEAAREAAVAKAGEERAAREAAEAAREAAEAAREAAVADSLGTLTQCTILYVVAEFSFVLVSLSLYPLHSAAFETLRAIADRGVKLFMEKVIKLGSGSSADSVVSKHGHTGFTPQSDHAIRLGAGDALPRMEVSGFLDHFFKATVGHNTCFVDGVQLSCRPCVAVACRALALCMVYSYPTRRIPLSSPRGSSAYMRWLSCPRRRGLGTRQRVEVVLQLLVLALLRQPRPVVTER